MAEAYTQALLDHFRNPRNAGPIEDADAVGRAENPASGASIEVFLRVEGGRVAVARFQAQGCAATIAAGSVLTEMATGRAVEAAGEISRSDVERALGGLPPTRRHAADLAAAAIRAAAEDYCLRTQGEKRCGTQSP